MPKSEGSEKRGGSGQPARSDRGNTLQICCRDKILVEWPTLRRIQLKVKSTVKFGAVPDTLNVT